MRSYCDDYLLLKSLKILISSQEHPAACDLFLHLRGNVDEMSTLLFPHTLLVFPLYGHLPSPLYPSFPLLSFRVPLQIGGIRFLYDNLVESVERFSGSSGFGCILAHSMGLGKTLQVISFIDVLFRHTRAHTVLAIVPVSTRGVNPAFDLLY